MSESGTRSMQSRASGTTFESIFTRTLDMGVVRNLREELVIRNSAFAILLVSASALPVSLAVGLPVVGMLVPLLGLYAALGLWLIKRGRKTAAKHTLALGLMLQLVVECYVFSGAGVTSLGSVHFLLIPLVIVLHFVRIDNSGTWIIGYSLLCASIFFLVEFGVVFGDTRPIPLTSSQSVLARLYVFAAMWLALLSLMHIIMKHIDEAESNLRLLNGRLEELLENMLPKTIATRLKSEGKTFAEGFSDCSIVFLDLVGFTQMTEKALPDDLVALLNRLFSEFDELTERYGLEKIKTIGDAYMAAAGIPTFRPDHAQRAVRFAFSARELVAKFSGLNARIGVNSGPVVAGVIGRKRFIYDLWGDTVNVASRMESHGIAGEIHVTEATYRLIAQEFDCIPRGPLDVKGKGLMTSYLVLGPRKEKALARSKHVLARGGPPSSADTHFRAEE